MTVWSIKPLIEMSTRDIFYGVKGSRCVELTTLSPCADSL